MAFHPSFPRPPPPPFGVIEKSLAISEAEGGGRAEARGWGGSVCALCITEGGHRRSLESQVWEPPPMPFTGTLLFGLVIVKPI